MKKLFYLITVLLALNTALYSQSLKIISFNDFHGSLLEDTSPKGLNPGIAKMAAFIIQLQSQAKGNDIVVSAGDNFQGSALSVLTDGAPVIEVMNEVGVSASAVGNHEFDWGIAKIETWNKMAKFPFIAANIIDTRTDKAPSWVKPYVIVEREGLKIAFIGLTTEETAFKTVKENLENLKFINPAEALQKWIDYLKESDEKPNAIIALTHIASFQEEEGADISGDELVEICKKVKGVDAVITGHSHKRVAGEINGIKVVQGGHYGRSLGVIDMTFSDESKKLEIVTVSYAVVPKSIDPDKKAIEILAKYQEQIGKYIKTLAQAHGDIDHDREAKSLTKLGVFVCKAIAERFNVQMAFVNPGGLRDPLYKGEITNQRLYEIMPFDNTVYTMKLKGSDIKRVIEEKLNSPNKEEGNIQFYGLKIVYDASGEYKDRIKSIALLDGQELKMDEYYSVGAVDFIYKGGDNYDFSGAEDVHDTEVLLREVISDALIKAKKIVPPSTDHLIETTKETSLEEAA